MIFDNLKKEIVGTIDKMSLEEKINCINELKKELHEISPFKNEPVDCVLWIKNDKVCANDYNPNVVAPPEMELLKTSIEEDGYTQPIVGWETEGEVQVIDGFHRNRVGKESDIIKKRIFDYLPLAIINKKSSERGNRIASTIRHNRARGKHTVDSMSDIVLELKNRNWTNKRISKELGMDDDEILRLCQISGLEDIFKDDDFSKAWNIEDSQENDFVYFDDEVTDEEKKTNGFRTVNTSDITRIFHTYDSWECYKSGFYNKTKDGMTKEQCEIEYAKFLTNEKLFRDALKKVITEWKNSCEHYLTNKSMNRIAWLGQASLCYAKGIPSEFRSGFNLLSEEQQEKANRIAHEYLNKWLVKNKIPTIEFEDALQIDRQVEIY